jgi:hypothetical protein
MVKSGEIPMKNTNPTAGALHHQEGQRQGHDVVFRLLPTSSLETQKNEGVQYLFDIV